jgi:type I restriction enzyme R subunit
MANAFRDGAISATGMAITTVVPPESRFSPGNDHAAKKQTVLTELAAHVDRFLGLL